MKKERPDTKVEYDKLREALANLSSLVDVELPFEISLSEGEDPSSESTLEALSGDFSFLKSRIRENPSIDTIKENFKTILEYLRRLHKKQGGNLDKTLLDGIQNIMMVVGDTAEKMDKYTDLFRKAHGGSITSLKEYKDLQDFYSRTIAKTSSDSILDLDFSDFSDLPALTNLNGGNEALMEEELKALADVEIVKNDTDYELFLIKRENGSRFFRNDLLRHMQSVSGLADYSGEFAGDDPFVQIRNWEDKRLQQCAAQLLKAIQEPLHIYYRSALKIKDMDLVLIMNKALMSLMMAGNPKNLLRQFSVKSCSQYFFDFQAFFNEALRSLDYQKMVDKPPKKSQTFLNALSEVILGLCYALFSHVFPSSEAVKGIERLIERGNSVEHPVPKKNELKTLSDYVEFDFDAIDHLLKQFPNGPLFKALDLFIDGNMDGFNPLMMDNLPHQLYSLDLEGLYTTNLRIPSPTAQTIIHQAMITEEFKGFLRAYYSSPIRKHHLLINLQDRTSWKEHARCEAIEQLQYNAEFHNSLTVVTLSKDTDFYFQLGSYQNLNQAKLFIEQFKDHLSSTQSGFYFPKKIESELFPAFIEKMLKAIHKVFFYENNVLTRRQRLDFIELSYIFIQCKLIDLTGAYSLSFTCKDGIDTGAITASQFFVFLKFINGKEFNEAEIAHLRLMLFMPAVMIRERLVNSERFNRMLHLVRLLEHEIQQTSQGDLKHRIDVEFSPLFTRPILNANIDLPKPPVIE